MTKYVYDEHFTQRNHEKIVKANIYILPELTIRTKFFDTETQEESQATGIQVFLKNNYTNSQNNSKPKVFWARVREFSGRISNRWSEYPVTAPFKIESPNTAIFFIWFFWYGENKEDD